MSADVDDELSQNGDATRNYREEASTEEGNGSEHGTQEEAPERPKDSKEKRVTKQHRFVSTFSPWMSPDADFYQQRMKKYVPVVTPTWLLGLLLLIGTLFLCIGFGLLIINRRAHTFETVYAGQNISPSVRCISVDDSRSGFSNPVQRCTVPVRIAERMKSPVHVYYGIRNFYQSERRYVSSVNRDQLTSGKVYTSESRIKDCEPFTYIGDKIANPCGLQARAFFNDSIALNSESSQFTMRTTDIAWRSDVRAFKEPPQQEMEEAKDNFVFINEMFPGLESITDEHFVNWMRPAAFPTFRKLYGHIDQEIPKNTVVTFDIVSQWPVEEFGGEKSIILGNTSVLGGHNSFLPNAYIVTGLCLLGVFFLLGIKLISTGRRIVDTTWLKYEENSLIKPKKYKYMR